MNSDGCGSGCDGNGSRIKKPVNDHGGRLTMAGVFHAKLRSMEYVYGVYRFDGGEHLGECKWAVYSEVFFHMSEKNNLHAMENFSVILIMQRGSSLFVN